MGKGLAVTKSATWLAGGLALALLAACGNDKGEPSPLSQAVGTVAKATLGGIKARRAGKGTAAPAAAPVTRADIEKYGIPIMRAVIASRGADALLTVSEAKGDVTTWATTDGTSSANGAGFSWRLAWPLSTREPPGNGRWPESIS